MPMRLRARCELEEPLQDAVAAARVAQLRDARRLQALELKAELFLVFFRSCSVMRPVCQATLSSPVAMFLGMPVGHDMLAVLTRRLKILSLRVLLASVPDRDCPESRVSSWLSMLRLTRECAPPRVSELASFITRLNG